MFISKSCYYLGNVLNSWKFTRFTRLKRLKGFVLNLQDLKVFLNKSSGIMFEN